MKFSVIFWSKTKRREFLKLKIAVVKHFHPQKADIFNIFIQILWPFFDSAAVISSPFVWYNGIFWHMEWWEREIGIRWKFRNIFRKWGWRGGGGLTYLLSILNSKKKKIKLNTLRRERTKCLNIFSKLVKRLILEGILFFIGIIYFF